MTLKGHKYQQNDSVDANPRQNVHLKLKFYFKISVVLLENKLQLAIIVMLTTRLWIK